MTPIEQAKRIDPLLPRGWYVHEYADETDVIGCAKRAESEIVVT